MTLTLGMITFDSLDPGPLATWWAAQLGGNIVEENDGWFYIVAVPDSATNFAFQKVPDPTAGKNRIHLDLGSPDLDAEVAGSSRPELPSTTARTWTVSAG